MVINPHESRIAGCQVGVVLLSEDGKVILGSWRDWIPYNERVSGCRKTLGLARKLRNEKREAMIESGNYSLGGTCELAFTFPSRRPTAVATLWASCDLSLSRTQIA